MREPGSPHQTLQVTASLAGRPLLEALLQLAPQASASQAQRWIRSRHVELNGNLCLDPDRRVRTGDTLRLWSHPRTKPPDPRDIRVLHLDAQLVVIDKPAGVTTQREPDQAQRSDERAQRQPTLDEMLQSLLARRLAQPEHSAQGPTLRRRPPSTRRVRAVHRLDRDTSGLMVFALTPEAARELTAQFRAHKNRRSYLALVAGHPAPGRIESWLLRDRGDGLRGGGPVGEGEHAVTHVESVEPLGDVSLVRCRLETGRTHQLRIHLAEAGHPLLGDRVYRGPLGGRPPPDLSGAPRQALHAAELGFIHPATGLAMSFTSDWPDELRSLIERLRKLALKGREAEPRRGEPG